jgi:hypothetical protein
MGPEAIIVLEVFNQVRNRRVKRIINGGTALTNYLLYKRSGGKLYD